LKHGVGNPPSGERVFLLTKDGAMPANPENIFGPLSDDQMREIQLKVNVAGTHRPTLDSMKSDAVNRDEITSKLLGTFLNDPGSGLSLSAITVAPNPQAHTEPLTLPPLLVLEERLSKVDKPANPSRVEPIDLEMKRRFRW
jgi:hypothetical protein